MSNHLSHSLSEEPIRIEQVEFSDYGDVIGKLRAEVWLGKGKLDPAKVQDGKWLDGFDGDAFHWVAFRGTEVVASSRLHIVDSIENLPFPAVWEALGEEMAPPIAQIMRLVVASSVRGLGIGRRMDEVRIQKARALGVKTLLADADPERQSALLKQGFDLLTTLPAGTGSTGLLNGSSILVLKLN